MFSSDKNHRIEGDLYTLRTVTVFDQGAKTDESDMSRVQRRYNISMLPFVSIPCLGVNDEAIADAQDTLTVRGFDVFDSVKLGKLYTRISNCNNEESQKEISRELQYWSHYLAERMCLLMEKALKITGNKDLLKILNGFDNDYRSLSSVPYTSWVKEEMNTSVSCLDYYANEIKKLDVANSFKVFSNFDMALTSIINRNRAFFEDHKEFSCIEKTCIKYSRKLYTSLLHFAYNLAEICRCDEVKRDIELMRILYPVYKDVECFLKEGERVDLSSVQEKFKEECVRQTGLPEGAPSLDNHLARAEMQQVLSQAIKSVNGLLKVSEQNTFKLLECGLSQESELIGSLEAIAEVNESKKKLEKLCEKYGFGSIDSPKPQNTIEGQELKVEAQVGAAD